MIRTSLDDNNRAGRVVESYFMSNRARKSEPSLARGLENRLDLRDVARSFGN